MAARAELKNFCIDFDFDAVDETDRLAFSRCQSCTGKSVCLLSAGGYPLADDVRVEDYFEKLKKF